MTARVLILDIETQRGVMESFSLFPNYIHIDRVLTPARILCFAAKWHDSDKTLFKAAWDDEDPDSYIAMLQYAWDLLDEADFVVTWNGDKFDVQWLEGEFGRLQMGRPSPYRSLDLIKTAKRHFGRSLMSKKLDWSSRQWLGDRKTSHGATDLWHDIRYGTRDEKRAARKIMREYNIHDVELTDQLFHRYLPWIGANFALYDPASEDLTVCPKCASENIHKRGFFYTTTLKYQRYRCKDCKSWSRGKRSIYSTELRPV